MLFSFRNLIRLLVVTMLVAGHGSVATAQEQPESNADQTEEARPEPTGADRAYTPPKVAEPPLPELPPTPVLLQKDYPDCREDHQSIEAPFDKADDINRCTVALDRYYTDVLNAFRKRMNEHQDRNFPALYRESCRKQGLFCGQSAEIL